MTGVLGKPYLVRQDIAVAVGTTQAIGFRWFKATDPAGSDKEAVDLSAYTGTVLLESLGGDPWLEFSPSLHFDGMCEVALTPTMTSGPEWGARDSGRWSVTVTAPDGTVTCIAAGYVRVIHAGGL